MRVLFIGEDPEKALAIRRALAESGRDGYRLEHAEGISRGIDRAAGDPPTSSCSSWRATAATA
jgi:hypothetical protein